MKEVVRTIALFVHDGPLYKDKDGTYCSTDITEEMLSRYFCVADEVRVLIRTCQIDKTYKEAKLQKIDNPKIKIIELGNVVSVKGLLQKNKLKNVIKPIVSECDLFFLRLPGITCNVVAEICKQQGKKYLVEVGGCAWDAYWNHGILGKLVAPYMEFSEKKTIKDASFATYVTHQWLQDRYPCTRESIEASNVYLPKHDEKLLQKRLERINSYNDCKNLTIGTIANVDVRYKGQEYVIKAIAKLNKKGYNFKYELVGGGDQAFLKNLVTKYGVERNVLFKGPLLHDDVMKWLDDIDIYAQPSKQEGLPRSVIEAMSRGVPCIGSDVAGIPELLDKECIFEKSNVKSITKEIVWIALNNNCLAQSKKNFAKSKKYDLAIIERRRQGLFERYKMLVKG
ncbi:glycosyltransferase family 4 protein [Candidatus Saccharibacteria bacterium]|nr:glycosyltransferase family 4 protein [Candidatus Saccharibacteria bacterium]